jgi:hypothetical protein
LFVCCFLCVIFWFPMLLKKIFWFVHVKYNAKTIYGKNWSVKAKLNQTLLNIKQILLSHLFFVCLILSWITAAFHEVFNTIHMI